MNSIAPLVSVIMPVYNGATYIRAAIESILNQTYANFELIVIDDGSTDDTRKVVKEYSNGRLRLVVQDKNYGLAYTRNNGINESCGKYIAMLDSDDVAAPNRLSEQVFFLETHADFSMVGSRLKVINDVGEMTGEQWNYPLSAELIPPLMLFQNYFAQSAVCIRRSSLPDCPYRLEFPSAEDYDLWVRIAQTGKVWNIPQYLLLHRRHSQSTSARFTAIMEDAVSRIVTTQLLELGVEPTKYELSLHRSIGEKIDCQWTSKRLQNLELWLLKLLAANQKKRLFSVASFKNIISDRWYSACRAAGLSGIEVVQLYIRSPLRLMEGRALLRDMSLLTRLFVNGMLKNNNTKSQLLE